MRHFFEAHQARAFPLREGNRQQSNAVRVESGDGLCTRQRCGRFRDLRSGAVGIGEDHVGSGEIGQIRATSAGRKVQAQY